MVKISVISSPETHGAYIQQGVKCVSHWINSREGFVIGIHDDVRSKNVMGTSHACDVAVSIKGDEILVHEIEHGVPTARKIDPQLYERYLENFLNNLVAASRPVPQEGYAFHAAGNSVLISRDGQPLGTSQTCGLLQALNSNTVREALDRAVKDAPR